MTTAGTASNHGTRCITDRRLRCGAAATTSVTRPLEGPWTKLGIDPDLRVVRPQRWIWARPGSGHLRATSYGRKDVPIAPRHFVDAHVLPRRRLIGSLFARQHVALGRDPTVGTKHVRDVDVVVPLVVV